MIHVIASITIKPGQVPAFLNAFKAIVPTVLEEEGCVQYTPAVDVDINISAQQLNENVVTIVEKWESVAALQAHLIAPHMEAYRETVKDLVASASLKVLQDA
jgi:quinol monooxygenase YgiN